ncbi:MAG TPA: L,D-transpeptidase family protein [Acidobacteriaceae bacterium]|nr:L,D-transpeptidase family protein [Acidobacteriaceae bacterium]
MKRRTICSFLALLLLASLLPLNGCRGGVKALWAKFHHRRAKSKENTTDYADRLASLASSNKLAILRWANYSDFQPQVQQFYDGRNYELAWTRNGLPTESAKALMRVFANAAEKGLVPADYDADRWPQRVQQLEQIQKTHDDSDSAEQAVAQFDVAMTVALTRYLSDIHLGRINPQALNFDIDVASRRAKFDIPALIDDNFVDADAGEIADQVAKLEPKNSLYEETEKALPKYLALAQQQKANPPQALPEVEKPVGKGGSYPAIADLWSRLQLEGDAPADTPAPARYDSTVAAAVKKFQERYGLQDDGRLGNGTIDALNVPMSRLVQQIDDSLERWRWLPDNFQQPRVMVNLPEFLVRTYDEDHALVFKMKIVDGEAKGNHDTPMFVRTMRYMIFRPYWNLPVSIIKKELVNHLGGAAGAAYMAKNDYEVVKGDGTPVTGWTVNDLVHGRYGVRQKPGPKNSLGLVKFMFPNEYDVYMHSTPEMNLFNLSRRDHSHGCIRLNDAEKMANWVLDGQDPWDEDSIHEAMYGPADGSDPQNNKQVGLKTPLTVNITYLTANADEDGTMHFFNDIYGYDKQLEDALAKGRPYEQTPIKINPKLTPGETE